MNGNQRRRLHPAVFGTLLRLTLVALLTACSTGTGMSPVSGSGWTKLRPGLDYAHFEDQTGSWHVTRLDLDQRDLSIFGSSESDRGRTVSDFAGAHEALVAVNGDYFDQDLAPVGPSRGFCGDWQVRAAPVSRKQPNFVAGTGRAAILDADQSLPEWATAAVSGWPRVVASCRAIPSAELPGSDFFTRAPHMRTAVGLSEDGRTVYFVVADRIEACEFGVTLPQLGRFMRDSLGACEALNLDGGGSSAMTVEQKLVSQPKSGRERNVANHLGIAETTRLPECSGEDLPSRDTLVEIARRLGLEAATGRSGVRVTLPWDEGSILLDHLGEEVLMSGSFVADAKKAKQVQQGLMGALKVSWTTPLDDGRVRVQLGGRAAQASVEGELAELLSYAR